MIAHAWHYAHQQQVRGLRAALASSGPDIANAGPWYGPDLSIHDDRRLDRKHAGVADRVRATAMVLALPDGTTWEDMLIRIAFDLQKNCVTLSATAPRDGQDSRRAQP